MLKLSCDNCNCRLYDDERVYCGECWQKTDGEIDELEATIRELERENKRLKKGDK